MNRKLLRVLDDIDKTEAKIAEWQAHLESLHKQRVQLEEKEIVKAVRAMNLTSRELVAVVDGLCTGDLTFAAVPAGRGMPGGVSGQAADVQADSVSMPEESETGDGTGHALKTSGNSGVGAGCDPDSGSADA